MTRSSRFESDFIRIQNDIRRPTARPECLPEAKLNDLVGLEKLVAGVLRRVPEGGGNASHLPDEAEHPASSPIYWVSKWVDYSDKYGIGMSHCCH